jgi:hypothetical protein
MTAATKWFALKNRSARQVGALGCLLLFVILQAAAISNSLHKAIHADAGEPGHNCVITLLAQGHVDAPATLPGLLAFVAAMYFLLPAPKPTFAFSVDCRLPSSRAPPRL